MLGASKGFNICKQAFMSVFVFLTLHVFVSTYSIIIPLQSDKDFVLCPGEHEYSSICHGKRGDDKLSHAKHKTTYMRCFSVF